MGQLTNNRPLNRAGLFFIWRHGGELKGAGLLNEHLRPALTLQPILKRRPPPPHPLHIFTYPFCEFSTHGFTANQQELQFLFVPPQVPGRFLQTKAQQHFYGGLLTVNARHGKRPREGEGGG